MTFSVSIPGESETLEMTDVWVLAPNIGKLKIALLDQFLNPRGWLTLINGTVGEDPVADIINPIVEIEPSIVSLSVTPDFGMAPLLVTATCNANDPNWRCSANFFE